jgi:hypothetical protein
MIAPLFLLCLSGMGTRNRWRGVVEKLAEWQRLKALVLESVSSPITRRVYNMALDEFMTWFRQEPRPGFSKATVHAWRVFLQALDSMIYVARDSGSPVLAEPRTPAKSGERLTIFCAGLGAWIPPWPQYFQCRTTPRKSKLPTFV